MRIYYIYELVDPRNQLSFYVGRTNNPRLRLKNHMSCNKKYNNATLFAKIEELKKDGVRASLNILEECSEAESGEREQFWIVELRSRGCILTNACKGGNGQTKGHQVRHSEETKEILRQKNLEQFSDSEKRERHRAGVKRWFANLTPDEQERLREVGRKELAKHRDPDRNSRTAKRHWNSMSPEERAEFISWRAEKLREANLRPEVKKIRSEVAKSRWADPERIAKNKEALRLAWSDPEKRAARRAKMTAAWAARRAAGITRPPMSDETKRKIRTAVTQTWNLPEMKQAQSERLKASAARRNAN